MDKLQNLKEEIETEKGASHARQRRSPGTASSVEYDYRRGLYFALKKLEGLVKDDKRD